MKKLTLILFLVFPALVFCDQASKDVLLNEWIEVSFKSDETRAMLNNMKNNFAGLGQMNLTDDQKKSISDLQEKMIDKIFSDESLSSFKKQMNKYFDENELKQLVEIAKNPVYKKLQSNMTDISREFGTAIMGVVQEMQADFVALSNKFAENPKLELAEEAK